jgi:peptide/nickel transport system substrate-binding protein
LTGTEDFLRCPVKAVGRLPIMKGEWKMRKQSLIEVLCVCLTVGLFVQPAAAAPKDPIRVVIGLNSDARSLDPVLTMDATTIRVLRHLYDALFFRDRDMKVIPELAESYKFDDNLTWLIRLRKGIKFHNGEPFNADAVKTTIDFVLNPENKAITRSLVDRIDRVEAVDDYTVKIVTKEPFITLPENLIEVFIAPPKLVKEKGMTHLTSNPVGTGPYKLKSWAKDREIVLVKNESYFKGVPPIDEIVVRIIPEVGPRVSALVVGEVDLIPDVPPHLIQQINGSRTAKVKGVPGRRVIFIALDNVNEGPMRDVRVRQAMNYGVNVDEIIRTVMEGYATRIPGPLIPINTGYDPTLKPYPYDPKKARELLKEAGYEKGLNLTLHSCQDRYLKDKEYAQAVASQLSKIGVNVQVKFYEWGNYLQHLRSRKLPNGKFGNVLSEFHLNGRSDRELEGGIMYAWFKSGASWVAFSDPEIDKALDATLTIVNPEKRKEALNKLQRQIQAAAPWIFLWEQHDLYGVSDKLIWEPRADEQLYLFEATVKR